MDDVDSHLKILVAKTREGCEVSYRALLEAVLPKIRHWCFYELSRFSKASLTEDITQEVLLTIHLKLGSYNDSWPFLAWLKAVTKHKLIDALRRERTDAVSLSDVFDDDIKDTKTEASSSLRDLEKLLNLLKPPIGDLIYALKVEGESIKDLSVRYGLTQSNIKVMVHRGLQKLAKLISESKGAYDEDK